MDVFQKYIIICVQRYRALHNSNPKIFVGKRTLCDLINYDKLSYSIESEKEFCYYLTFDGCDVETDNTFDYGFYFI